MLKLQFISYSRIIVFCFIFLSSCKERNYTDVKEKVLVKNQKVFSKKQGEKINGLVIGISDGDTFKLLMDNEFSVKIRLNGIDCPEKKQAFSKKAKEALSNLIFQKEVVVKYKKKDGFGRVLGDVYINNLNVNQEMVRLGYAWHFKKYSDDEELAQLEANARESKVGLWADSNPIAPWDYRKNKN